VNPAFVEDVTEVVEFEDASGIGFDRTAPEPEIDLEFETPDEGSFFDGESVTQAETGEAQASGVNESFVEYVEDVTPVESFNRSAPEALVDLNDGFAEADGSEAFFQEEISTPEAPDPSFIESISGVSTPTEMFFEEQTGGRQASAGQGVNFFENPKIDGLEFDNQSGAMLEWGQPQATGPVLGPVLAPAGAEVLWIPIPNGQMLRIPLTGSGTFQVYERGYPLDDTFVNVPTSGSVQDEIND
jgi:hypothetical protein